MRHMAETKGTGKIPLNQAEKIAAEVVEKLKPYCKRIEVAGVHPPAQAPCGQQIRRRQ